MFGRDAVGIFMVNRRIGGLENARRSLLAYSAVNRRIGGLEMLNRPLSLFGLVNRRIGGLEINKYIWSR